MYDGHDAANPGWVSSFIAINVPGSGQARYLDPREFVNVMSTQAGKQVILSTIRANAPTVRQDLG